MNRRNRNNFQKIRFGFCILIVFALLSGCTLEYGDFTGWETNQEQPRQSSLDTSKQLRVIFLDVGQGASQLLISPSGRTMLIDGGNNDREQQMLDYLKQYGVGRIDIIIGTHPDADHIGGLDAVIDHHEVGAVYMPKIQSNTKTFESLLISIRNRGLKVKTAKAGLDLDWDEGINVSMLAPVETYDDNNNMSAVLKVTYGETSFFLTGDAERESENGMIDSNADLSADVLLVGHHGSKSSTSASFLKKVAPQLAVIQVGENSYGHPKQEILDRLSKNGVKVYRNDLQGTIEVNSDGHRLNITTER